MEVKVANLTPKYLWKKLYLNDENFFDGKDKKKWYWANADVFFDNGSFIPFFFYGFYYSFQKLIITYL